MCSRIHFWLTAEGQLHVSVNHQQVTRLATGVSPDRPLWALIDVYGNTQSVQVTGDGEELKATRLSALCVQAVQAVWCEW